MYLQITTRCNMKCAHCCYSCAPGKGKHGTFSTIMDAIRFASRYDEHISLGGGEPTLHPRFWEILTKCIDTFDYVWFATNGTNKKNMLRLASLINNGYWMDAELETEEEQDKTYIALTSQDQLGVALSTDWAHDSSMVDARVRSIWESNARQHRRTGFELRDVMASYSGAAAAGRAKLTGAGVGTHCVCPDRIIKPDGTIRACGCTRSPVIGDIWEGYNEVEEKLQRSTKYLDTYCAFGRS